jgi:hypothetical protein
MSERCLFIRQFGGSCESLCKEIARWEIQLEPKKSRQLLLESCQIISIKAKIAYLHQLVY